MLLAFWRCLLIKALHVWLSDDVFNAEKKEGKKRFSHRVHCCLCAGFKGIWASGLSISAQLCVRDSNEASWTQVLEVLEFMNDACDVPILVDADTGYGNFNNARRLVRKLEDRGIAG